MAGSRASTLGCDWLEYCKKWNMQSTIVPSIVLTHSSLDNEVQVSKKRKKIKHI